MKHVQISKVWDLHKYAEKTYALDQPVLTQEFDSAVDHLIRCWDDLCNLLEEHGRQAAKKRETVSVEGLDEAEALGMTKAAVYAIDSARRHHMWEYRGDLPNRHKFFQSDVNVVGLSTLKKRFNDFLDQERRCRGEIFDNLEIFDKLSVRTFKSLDDVTVDLGLVNVFIGANGSGKSNLLEALGILSAAADGKVDDQALLARGVRPGLPALYKSAFPAKPGKRIPPHLHFGARSARAGYEVSLHNPLKDPAPAWRFKTEIWEDDEGRLLERLPTKTNPERGLAALKAAEVRARAALDLLKSLQGYVIFSPTTAVLRGVAPETQPRQPVGLSGGNLPRAILDLLKQRKRNDRSRWICREVRGLLDWAEEFGWTSSDQLLLSPTAAASKDVVRFRDRFMRKDRNVLSGYDAPEGALYALFLAVISGHEASPALCAVDNADHGLNPRLARSLMGYLCQWYLDSIQPRQILLTTHNPLVLDGLLLQDDRVRLFTVSRTSSGRTSVRRVAVDDSLLKKAKQGWSLSRLWVMGHLGGMPNV